MDEPQIGCSTATFRYASLDHALDRIQASGVAVVDLCLSPHWCPHFDPVSSSPLARRELGERIESRGLKLVALRAAAGTHLINDEGGQETEGRYQRKALELATELECPLLLVHTGRDTWGSTFDRHTTLVAEHLNELGRRGAEVGVRVAIVCPHVGQLGQFFDRAKRMIAKTDPALIGVALDTAHVRLSGGALSDALDAFGERVSHVYLRDYKDGHYLVTPGDGDIRWTDFFSRLRSTGYRGVCTLALEYPGKDVAFHDSEYQRALAVIREAAHHAR